MAAHPRVRLNVAGAPRDLAPGDALALALNLHRAGRLDEADAVYASIRAAVPEHFDALHLQGVLRHQQARYPEAAELITRALDVMPASADALCNLGAVHRAVGKLEEAAAALRRAVQIAPSLAQAHNNLGGVLQDLGRGREAEAAWRRAIELDPALVDAQANLAGLLHERGELHAALQACDAALSIDARHARALATLGNVRRALQHGAQALEALRRSLEIDPAQPDVHFNLGLVLDDRGDPAGALQAYDRALHLDHEHGPALSAALVTRRMLAAWDGLAALRAGFFAAVAKGVPDLSPFALLLEDSTLEQQYACAGRWGRQRAAQLRAERPLFQSSDRRAGPLRIGYLSADLYRHPTAYLIAGMIEAHDRPSFHVYAYSSGPDDSSAIRKRLIGAFDTFRDVHGWSPRSLAEQIHADRIDVLIDLKGYTLDAKTEVLALRPAPIQVNWLGYPGTMGVSYMDYIIADEVVIPRGDDRFYAEKVVRVPGCYQVNDRRRRIAPEIRSRAASGLPERSFVFCCFNAPQKISPELFTIWMTILHETGDSVLWLLDAQPGTALKGNLRREAEARGVAGERLVFAGRLPLEDYLANYRNADLFLDTIPYNAHTTGSDALWAGCPMLTCRGATFASRVAASLLHAAGLPELVAGTLEEYREKAIAFGTGEARDALIGLRDRLAQNRLRCALFDTVASTRHMEEAYRHMHARYARGEPPAAIWIK
ncbi:tetratricopeptide repeat protein [soil metagenome]